MTITMAKQRAPRVRLPAIELAAPLAMVFLLAAPAARADIKVQPSISARETYTDNASLIANNNSNGQFVSEVSPALAIFENGPRLKLQFQALGHLYAYSGDRPTGTSSSTLDLRGNGQATVIKDLFYVDGSVNRARQAISLLGQQNQTLFSNGNGYANANTDTVITYSISPYLVHRFGTFAEARVRYTHDGVDAQNLSQYKSTSDSLALNLSSGPKFTRFGWQLSGYRQQLKDYTIGNSQVENISGTLRYFARDSFSLYTNAGYDKYTYQGLGGTTEGKNYALGFTWKPSLRTSIDASAGRRFFGKTYSLAASHRSRNTVFTTSYHERPVPAAGFDRHGQPARCHLCRRLPGSHPAAPGHRRLYSRSGLADQRRQQPKLSQQPPLPAKAVPGSRCVEWQPQHIHPFGRQYQAGGAVLGGERYRPAQFGHSCHQRQHPRAQCHGGIELPSDVALLGHVEHVEVT
jgi:hypothetical protein